MNNLTSEEAIDRIRNVYLCEYDPHSSMTAYDQLAACESIGIPPYPTQGNYKTNGNTNVNGMVNDTCKPNANYELTQSKISVINELKNTSYRTPPFEIAILLDSFFDDPISKEGHWLYIAQHWTPRTILRVINRINRLRTTGAKTIRNPPGYFTYLIKFRKQRKEYQ